VRKDEFRKMADKRRSGVKVSGLDREFALYV
jgi:hypothetical protein